jgi:hypothetical protein
MDSTQRRQPRIGVSLEVHIDGTSANGAKFSESTHSTDVSRNGCSFPSTHDLPVGSELYIEIYRRNAGPGPSPFLTRGQVVRQFVLEDGTKMIGVHFIGPQFPTYSRESI